MSLSGEDQKELLAICNSGIENADSGMGCYAMNPTVGIMLQLFQECFVMPESSLLTVLSPSLTMCIVLIRDFQQDYDKFQPFMEAVIKDYHKIGGSVKHVTNWDLSTPKIAAKLPAGGKLDLAKLGLGTTSMRVRVGRNLAAFPLPGAMSKDDRITMEASMVEAFEKLIADPAYGKC